MPTSSLDELVSTHPTDTDSAAPAGNAPSVPVLVLGGGLTATGVLRSLGRSRIPALCMTQDCAQLSSSRWFRSIPGVSGRTPRPSELEEYLGLLPVSSAVLIPCADDWLESVVRLPADVRRRFPASVCSEAAARVCLDKAVFAKFLQHSGLPHPHTRILHSVAEMQALEEEHYRGRFLKPVSSLKFSRQHGVKAFLIDSKAKAIALMTPDEAGGDFPILLQEYIPGPPTNHYFVDGFVDRHGAVASLFARQRIRMFPAMLGNSTLMKTIQVDQVSGAVDTIRAICSKLRYRGIFSAEFKLDPRDGVFRLLEINARPWWYVEFATRCGVDVCAMAWRDALGLPAGSTPTYKSGIRCVYLPKDFKAYREDSNGGSVFTWLRSWLGAENAVFAWDDPRPAFTYLREMLSHNLKVRER
jgi:D-aspartate ligase